MPVLANKTDEFIWELDTNGLPNLGQKVRKFKKKRKKKKRRKKKEEKKEEKELVVSWILPFRRRTKLKQKKAKKKKKKKKQILGTLQRYREGVEPASEGDTNCN